MVGFVTEIELQGDINTLETQVQVIMQLFPDQFVVTKKGVAVTEAARETVDAQDLINAGLRAQLNAESFVTGQLLIELDFHPDTPPLYRGERPPHPEIPTIPSGIERVLADLQTFMAQVQEHLDVETAIDNLQSALRGIDELANSQDIRDSLAGLNRIINDDNTQRLTSDLRLALDDARKALQDARKLVNNADAKIGPLVDELMPAIDRLDGALGAAQDALRNASRQIQGDTELAYELNSTLDELQGAARSLRVFLDFIERNPEALIRGKRQ